ncbi:Ubiquitin-like protein [Venustampulla echinocandica]|uniref:Ubiquitin-like protein n=1 Tax=Venustampulla echinocandica TaxID=2656787 RepID=A0A370TZY5_9HELO|nr:Ubiquitin-like protein [Venustampulla echinocandica]RDL41068.1 Ubiquitin-like protein [Venustampulla echinocandica]
MASIEADTTATAGVDINDLSEVQQLALQQYTSVTNQDAQAAIPLLRRSQWNVEIAVTKFFDGEGPDLVAEALAAQNAPPPPRAARRENLQHSLLRPSLNPPTRQPHPDAAPRIVPQPADQVIPRPSLLLAILFTPFRVLYKIFSLPLNLFAYLFPFLPIFRRDAAAGALRRANTSGRRPLSPADTAQRVQREFSEEYGENELPWSGFGYATSLDYTKREHGFLLVVLLSPEHDDTLTFCRDVLMNPDVNQFIKDPNHMIRLWVGDVRDAEAYQVSTALKCNKFPFTALICNTPEVNSTTISVVSRIVGPMDPNTYLAKLRTAHAARTEALEQGRAARAFQNAERNLRQEQDSAYERSLAQDRERARLRREAEAAAEEAERRKKEEEGNAALLAANKEQWRKWRAAQIAPEPSADEKDVVRIALKMPEAARVMRRFRASDPIDELYAFVECYDHVKEGSSGEKAPEKPEAYVHNYNFQIVSTLPRVVYDVEQGGSIGEKVGRSGNLIVEQITDDDDEDDNEGEGYGQ